MILRFGKFKGKELADTPKWYQDWLIAQPWFRENPSYNRLTASSPQAIIDRKYEEWTHKLKSEMCQEGTCSCCEGSIYYGA